MQFRRTYQQGVAARGPRYSVMDVHLRLLSRGTQRNSNENPRLGTQHCTNVITRPFVLDAGIGAAAADRHDRYQEQFSTYRPLLTIIPCNILYELTQPAYAQNSSSRVLLSNRRYHARYNCMCLHLPQRETHTNTARGRWKEKLLYALQFANLERG